MTIHEFGKGNDEIVVLIHPSAVMWDYCEYVIPLKEISFTHRLLIRMCDGFVNMKIVKIRICDKTVRGKEICRWDCLSVL